MPVLNKKITVNNGVQVPSEKKELTFLQIPYDQVEEMQDRIIDDIPPTGRLQVTIAQGAFDEIVLTIKSGAPIVYVVPLAPPDSKLQDINFGVLEDTLRMAVKYFERLSSTPVM